jgi:HAD superfamily phosphatase (TIGR01668 family)
MGADMPFPLLPRIIVTALPDITPELLEDHDIDLLMLDFDNTIVPYTTNIPSESMEKWLKEMVSSNIQLCVVSNSKNDRVKLFCKQYGIACITHAKKPFAKGIRQCLEKFHIRPEQAALAGDQIFTDVLGSNCAGVTSILVKAIDNHNIWLKLRHVAEMPFIFAARKRRV